MKHAKFYPAPPTLPDDITPPDQAVYIPALPPNFTQKVYEWSQTKLPRQLSQGVTAADLNFLDQNNKLFRISHCLTSAGLALKKKQPCIITTRDRARTRTISDSGGFQVSSNKLKVRNDKDRERILRWQENHDIAITLDVPTGPLLRPDKYAYKTFEHCLDATLQHLDFYQKHRGNKDVIWLNVLQGNTQRQTDEWYDAVRDRFDGDGWAFAGPLRHNFYFLLRRILIMHAQGEIQKKRWIHVLGTSQLHVAVLLTALQRAINKHMNPNLRISYDTSSPFRMLLANNAYTFPLLNAKGMSMQSQKAMDSARARKSPIRWQWRSPLGDRITLGDFCVGPNSKGRYRDPLSYVLLAHHNLSALCEGIAWVNRVFDAAMLNEDFDGAYRIGYAATAIDEVIEAKDLDALNQRASIFTNLPHGKIDRDSEAERDVERYAGKLE